MVGLSLVLVVEDHHALEEQVAVLDHLPLTMGGDQHGQTAGADHGAAGAQFLLDVADGTVEGGGSAENQTASHAVHGVASDGLFRRF